MPLLWLLLTVVVIATGGYIAGRSRVLQSVDGDRRVMHSLPSYYGGNVALKAAVPALILLAIWLLIQPIYVNNTVSALIPDRAIAESSSRGLVLSEVRRTAEGLDLAIENGVMDEAFARDARMELSNVTERLQEAGAIVTSQITQPVLRAAQQYRIMNATGSTIMTVVVILLSVAGAVWGLREAVPDFRARNTVERAVRYLLIGAASIAILTTLGIVLSLVFNTVAFFQLYPASEFFFGTNWAPSFSGRGGSSDLGVIPLLWGTFYISIVALAVAIPIGLFAAIYLSEYASPACAPLPSLCSKCSPVSRPSFTVFSRC